MVILGPEGTNSHLAALAVAKRLEGIYGPLKFHFVHENGDVLETVAYEKCPGIVATSNTVAGLVKGVVTDFWSQQHNGVGVQVIGEHRLLVEHHLIVRASLRSVNEIIGIASHPHAFPQCKITLEALGLGNVPQIDVGSTAEAARMVASDNAMRRVAAIATWKAADVFGLKVLKSNVEDRRGNTTRFHLLGPARAEPGIRNRTAVICRMPNQTSNYRRLRSAIDRGRAQDPLIVLISAESASESVFYCEFDGHRDRSVGRHILNRLQKLGAVMILGSYPTG